MRQNMKVEKGFTFITEVGYLLFITKVFKNNRIDACEFTQTGVEEVEYEYDEEDKLVGKDSHIVYSVIDNTGKVIKDRTSFYFNRNFASSIAKEMNKHIGEKKKPYKVKKYYLLDFK